MLGHFGNAGVEVKLDTRIHKIEDQLDDPITRDWEDGAQEREGDEVLEGMGLAGLKEMELIRAALKRIDDDRHGVRVFFEHHARNRLSGNRHWRVGFAP